MLSRANRLSSTTMFTDAVRRGRRGSSTTMVLHLSVSTAGLMEEQGNARHSAAERTQPRVGFVVSRAVGTAVTRNQVKRRLRHLVRERLSSLPGASVLVVRALPPSADASYAELAADLDAALGKLGRGTEPVRP